MAMESKIINYTMLIAVLLFLTGCNTGIKHDSIKESSNVIMNLAAQKAKEMIDENNSNPDFIILDIRTPGEYSDGHIKDARNIDYYEPDFRDQLGRLDRSKKYLIYCRSGNRSGSTLGIMKKLGFKEVYTLSGGIITWLDRKYELIKRR